MWGPRTLNADDDDDDRPIHLSTCSKRIVQNSSRSGQFNHYNSLEFQFYKYLGMDYDNVSQDTPGILAFWHRNKDSLVKCKL